ncbi:MAG: hypothetical protein U0903_02140 [Planctomycetales bacterium]
MQTLIKLWRNQDGFVISTEYVLIGSVCVLTLAIGLKDVGRVIDEQTQLSARSFDSLPDSTRYAGLDQPVSNPSPNTSINSF